MENDDGSSQSATQPAEQRVADSFPLWFDVPGRTFVTLGEGRLKGRSHWAVYASRVGGGERGRENPCLSVARIAGDGGYGDAHRCGEPAPAANQPPVYVSLTGSYQNHPSGPVIGEAVMGLSFRSDVERVKLMFVGGESMVLPTKFVNATQRRKTRLPDFRYVALGLQSDVCVEAVAGYTGQGRLIFESSTRLC